MNDKINIGFIGCGGHSWRNVFPALQFSPVNLIATCDLNEERASQFARQFGALRHYTNHLEMLEKEDLDAVFIVAGYDKDKQILHGKLAMDVMRAGCHAWIEKPPAKCGLDYALETCKLYEALCGPSRQIIRL